MAEHGGSRSGNVVAIALSALAVVLAATGTAVAVTATKVNIADPAKPANVAHVDSAGRLNTGPALSTIDVTGYAYESTTLPATTILGPTHATLAITALNFINGRNLTTPSGNDYFVTLYKVTVGSNGTCYDSDVTDTPLRGASVLVGQTSSQSFPEPFELKPTGGKAYCLSALVQTEDSVQPGPESPAEIDVNGYVVAGTYHAAATNAVAPGLRHAHP